MPESPMPAFNVGGAIFVAGIGDPGNAVA